jgi:hypothetical protein
MRYRRSYSSIGLRWATKDACVRIRSDRGMGGACFCGAQLWRSCIARNSDLDRRCAHDKSNETECDDRDCRQCRSNFATINRKSSISRQMGSATFNPVLRTNLNGKHCSNESNDLLIAYVAERSTHNALNVPRFFDDPE